MKQPPGYIKPGEEHKICKLNRAIYGLHQSGREWFYEIHSFLLKIGFKKFEGCNCAYTFGTDVVLILYVDDFVLFGKTKTASDKVLKILESHFDTKILGKTRKLLGVEFCEEKEGIFIHQTSYISEIYDRYKQYNIPISSLPITKGVTFSKQDCPQTEIELNEISKLPYRNILGCLSFIASRSSNI